MTDATSTALLGDPGISLLFAPGRRPRAEAVVTLAESLQSVGELPGGLLIGHLPPAPEGWVELLVSGLAFDVSGLAPAPAGTPPVRRHVFGLDGPELSPDLEAVRLIPSHHIIGGAAMPPVVRALVGLAAVLTRLEGVRAVCWHPAGTLIETTLFVRLIAGWLAGGAFPALGLTALVRDDDGGLRSEGLAFFIGQEIRIEPQSGEPASDAAKLAVRLIHRLVEDGRVEKVEELFAYDGTLLDAEPSLDRRLLRIWRRR